MAPTGSPSQFDDVGIHFSCSDKSQEQNKIGLARPCGVRGGGVYRALTKGQFSQLAIGIDTSSFQFWKLHTPLINFI